MEKESVPVVMKNSALQCKLAPKDENVPFSNYFGMDYKFGQENGQQKTSKDSTSSDCLMDYTFGQEDGQRKTLKDSTSSDCLMDYTFGQENGQRKTSKDSTSSSVIPELVSNKENTCFPSCSKDFELDYKSSVRGGTGQQKSSNFSLSATIPEIVPKNGIPPFQAKPLTDNKRQNGLPFTSVSRTLSTDNAGNGRKIFTFPSLPNLEFVQEFGQRKYTAPGWVGCPPPPKGCEVFIGKLPRDAFEPELLPLFQSVAEVYEFRLMVDFSGTSRGFAFAKYTNREGARRAIECLDGYLIRPRHKIGVIKSVDNRKLFVGGVPTRKTNAQVYEEMCRYTAGVVRVSLYPSPSDCTKNRGFAFVEYEDHRAASEARRVLFSGQVEPFDKKVTVDWAEPEPDVDDHYMKEVASLYVRNIPSHVDERHLHSIFSLNGRLIVQKVRKLRDFAFIHFFNRNDAEKALSHFDGASLGGSVIEVTWAKPRLQKCVSRKVQPHISHPPVTDFSNSVIPSYALFNNPIQLLYYICQKFGFGEPIYEVSQSHSGILKSKVTFTAQVLIHNWPLPVNHFSPNESSNSAHEAKQKAATCALKCIEFYKCLMDPSSFLNPTPSEASTSTAAINSHLPNRRREQIHTMHTDFDELQNCSPFLNDALSGDPDSELMVNLLPTAVAWVKYFWGLADPSRNN